MKNSYILVHISDIGPITLSYKRHFLMGGKIKSDAAQGAGPVTSHAVGAWTEEGCCGSAAGPKVGWDLWARSALENLTD